VSSNGFIKLYRKMLTWEWYTDSVTKDVFLHLLLTANYEDGRYKGIEVKRGQVMTSVRKLAKELGFSEQNIKTALKHLISTQEITQESTHLYTLITLNNFDAFQSVGNTVSNTEVTQHQHSANTVHTNIKEIKEEKEIKNISPSSMVSADKKAETMEEIKSNIEYDYLNEEIPTEFLNLVVEVLTDECINSKSWADYTKAVTVSAEDVEYVYENSWVNSKQEIRNPRGYLRTLLLKAETERVAMEDRMIKKIGVE
jgi:predicted transcriptional regulator